MRNKLAQKIKLGAALLLMAGTSAFAQTSNQIYTPTPENIKARQEFQDLSSTYKCNFLGADNKQ